MKTVGNQGKQKASNVFIWNRMSHEQVSSLQAGVQAGGERGQGRRQVRRCGRGADSCGGGGGRKKAHRIKVENLPQTGRLGQGRTRRGQAKVNEGKRSERVIKTRTDSDERLEYISYRRIAG